MATTSTKQIVFQPVETKRTFEEIADQIKESIFDGTLEPGDRLPSELELARQFGVGRQTIREALRFLEMSGFITIQRGTKGGPVIENTILHIASNSLMNAIQMQNITLDDLTAARIEIERGVLMHVMKNSDASDIKMLQENVSKAKGEIKNNIRASALNVEFHRLLAKATKNPVFEIVVDSIMAVAADYLSRIELGLEQSKRSVNDHEALLSAIIEKNTTKAVKVLEDHLRLLGSLYQTVNDKE
jgi:DNA-binding FadR family transcriptional regulator